MDVATILLLSSGFSALCLAVACLMFGLWWGERGRRQDTQRILHVAESEKATVIEGEAPAEQVALERAEGIDREQFIEDAMQEGLSKSQAEKDWEDAREQIQAVGRRTAS